MQQILLDFIGKYKDRVDQGIAEELERRLKEVKEISPHLVKILQAMQELSVGGKRIRAMLTILGYQIALADDNPPLQNGIIKAAVVMELFHLGLLIQDDFMDRDLVRRGVPTMIARYDDPHVGNFVSMLAGDYTFGWGMEIISGIKLSAKRVNKAIGVWGKYFARVGYGQTLDGLDIADDKTILKILAIKSGEYSCVLPLLFGATLGGGDKTLLDNLEKFGMELGWVFQLRDDYLGYEKDMAKKRKKTYATMYGKNKTEEAIEAHMREAKGCLRPARIATQSVAGGGLSSQGRILLAMVTWMGTREN